MSDENKYKDLFEKIMTYEDKMHIQNQKRIRVGLKCLLWIPMIFLVMLFVTESEKVVFLVLWIVSLFLISVYLIYVEYADFKMQELISELSGRDEENTELLIGQDIIEKEANIVKTLKDIESKRDETREKAKEVVVQRIEDRKESMSQRIESRRESIRNRLEKENEEIFDFEEEKMTNQQEESKVDSEPEVKSKTDNTKKNKK